jgi:hypothetical protein
MSPLTTRPAARALVTLTAIVAVTVGTATACASTSKTAAPPARTATSASASPSIQPGGPNSSAPVTPLPSASVTGATPVAPTTGGGSTSIHATGYRSDGDTLTVSFLGGSCDTYGLQADQSQADSVVVAVVITKYPAPGHVCSMLIGQRTVSVDLGRPLDGRTVVDRATDKQVPQVNTLPTAAAKTHGPTKTG